VTDFRTVVEEDALPKPSQLRGLVKGMTAGEKAEDYLRKLRGDGPGLPHRASHFFNHHRFLVSSAFIVVHLAGLEAPHRYRKCQALFTKIVRSLLMNIDIW
jgi:hypothetical protein